MGNPGVHVAGASSFVGHHITATFELRAGVVKAEARRVERSESLDDVEHSSMLIMRWPTQPITEREICVERAVRSVRDLR